LNLTWYGYNVLLSTVGYGVFSLLRRSSTFSGERQFWEGRLGRGAVGRMAAASGSPRLWVHAASVGEVTGAIATMRLLRRRYLDGAIWLTVGTPAGYRYARAQLGQIAHIQPFPLDFPWVMRKTLHFLRPDLYVALESELWPNLFWFLRRQRVPALLLNGRISERSARKYRMLGPIYRPILRHFCQLAMHSAADRERAVALGAPADRTLVLGSAKYDWLLARAEASDPEMWRKRLAIGASTIVAVGGSLRRAECIGLLDVVRRIHQHRPQMLGIFAPRHLEQIPRMAEWLRDQRLPFQLLSQLQTEAETRTAPVVLVDQVGVLFELYALGDLIFCGGTLEPIGGHNILEPAAWGKAVFYGPHVEKVADEHRRLQAAGGSHRVANDRQLFELWTYWLDHLPELAEHGAKAREALRGLGGVAARQVEIIASCLQTAKCTTGR
jgi:3-deoxy-D-manno-octulosonic-acid transferase